MAACTWAMGQELKPPPNTGYRICVAVGEQKQAPYIFRDPNAAITAEPFGVAKVSIVTPDGNARSQVVFAGQKPGLAVVRIIHQQPLLGQTKPLEFKTWYYVTVSQDRSTDPNICQGVGDPSAPRSGTANTAPKTGNQSGANNPSSGGNAKPDTAAKPITSARSEQDRASDNVPKGNSSNALSAGGNAPEVVYQRVLDYLQRAQSEIVDLRSQATTESAGKGTDDISGQIKNQFESPLVTSIHGIQNYLALATKNPSSVSGYKRDAYHQVISAITSTWAVHIRVAQARINALQNTNQALSTSKYQMIGQKKSEVNGNRIPENAVKLCPLYVPDDLEMIKQFAEGYDRIANELAAVYRRLRDDATQWAAFAAKDGYPPAPRESFTDLLLHQNFNDLTGKSGVPPTNNLGCHAYAEFYRGYHDRFPEIIPPEQVEMSVRFSMEPLFASKPSAAKVLAVNFYQQRTPNDLTGPSFTVGPIAQLTIGVPVVAEVIYNIDPKVDVITVQITVGGKQLSLTARRAADQTKFRTDPFVPWPQG